MSLFQEKPCDQTSSIAGKFFEAGGDDLVETCSVRCKKKHEQSSNRYNLRAEQTEVSDSVAGVKNRYDNEPKEVDNPCPNNQQVRNCLQERCGTSLRHGSAGNLAASITSLGDEPGRPWLLFLRSMVVNAKLTGTERWVPVPRGAKVQAKGPDSPPEQTLRVLRQQLEKLQAFKGKNHREVENDETVWKQITEGALIHGFGEGSRNVKHYYGARSAGVWNLYGVEDFQLQLNYNERIGKFEATLLSSIAELEASFPEAEVRGAYDAGDEYAFYKDLKDIMVRANADIFIVDNYLNTEFFELYVATVHPGISFRILTDAMKGNLEAVARKYAARHIFVDHRCWTVGQSIKDAAKKKPTYMVELSAGLVPMMRKIYEDLWTKATVVVKS